MSIQTSCQPRLHRLMKFESGEVDDYHKLKDLNCFKVQNLGRSRHHFEPSCQPRHYASFDMCMVNISCKVCTRSRLVMLNFRVIFDFLGP